MTLGSLVPQKKGSSLGPKHEPKDYPCRFTVCTPTFNRVRTLPRVYESLLQQSCQDFEWLIIDDESTDDTAEVVRQMTNRAPFPIRYFWQRHGHKKAAVNYGARMAKGEFILIWDSDDAAPPTAIGDLLAAWEGIPSQQRGSFAGVWGLCATPAGEVIGSVFPSGVFDSDYAAIQYLYRVRGEKWGFVRTDLLRTHPYPEHLEGYVPEGIVWARLGKSFKTRYINKIVRFYFDESDSLTHARFGIARNAPGLALWAAEMLKMELRHFFCSPIHFLRAAINLTRFRLHIQQSGCKAGLPKITVLGRILVACLWPIGVSAYVKDVLSSWRRGTIGTRKVRA